MFVMSIVMNLRRVFDGTADSTEGPAPPVSSAPSRPNFRSQLWECLPM